MEIPKPTAVDRVDLLTEMLDAAPHDVRLAWVRSLNGVEQYRLFDLAKEGPAFAASDMHRGEGDVVIHYGRNGLAMLNLFQKRCALVEGQLAGYNHSEAPGWIRPVLSPIIGPGHYVFYDSPDVPGEVWIDYRRIATAQHPAFPGLVDNESGLRQLVYGNMVDIMRRVSKHVFIGDSFKNLPRPDRPPLLTRLASRFGATAPFILCQAPAEG